MSSKDNMKKTDPDEEYNDEDVDDHRTSANNSTSDETKLATTREYNDNNDKKNHHDKLSQFELDILAKQNARGGGPNATSRPGVYAAVSSPSEATSHNTGMNHSNLTQLERDVLAKQNARGDNSAGAATRPGVAQSTGGFGSGDMNGNLHNNDSDPMKLTQLERDVRAKQAARGSTATKPGVVSSTASSASASLQPDSSQLSQFERDVLAKQVARNSNSGSGVAGAATQPLVSDSTRLSQLERDVLAKQAARGGVDGLPATRPGVTSSSSAAPTGLPSNLSQLERDVFAKQVARDTRGPASKPGAAATTMAATADTSSEHSNSLTQLERDVRAKQVTLGGIDGTTQERATQPGVVSSSARTSSAGMADHNNLTQLESDVLAKQAARGERASKPGAASATSSMSENHSNLSQLERDVLAKQVARDGMQRTTNSGVASVVSSSDQTNLSQLERDVYAKQAARGEDNTRASRPGVQAAAAATANSSPDHSHLSQLERDVLAKQAARGEDNTRAFRPGVQAGVATANSLTDQSSLSQLERDVLAKQSARGGGDGMASRPGVAMSSSVAHDQSNLSRLERDILAKQGAKGGDGRVVRPGVEGSDQSNLSQFERDVLAKQVARGGGEGYARAARPGVEASSSTPLADQSNLSQLERDVLAKQEAKGSSRGTDMQDTTSSLSQLERDVLTKQGARGGGGIALKHGIVPSSNQSVGDYSASQASAYTSNLSRLEEDVLSKQNAARSAGSSASRPGVVPARGGGGAQSNNTNENHLSRLERDVMAKQIATSGGASDYASDSKPKMYNNSSHTEGSNDNGNLSHLERDIRAKSNIGRSNASHPGVVPSSAFTNSQLQSQFVDSNVAMTLSQTELDIMAKNRARGLGDGSGHLGSQSGHSMAPSSVLDQLERDVAIKNAARSSAGSVPYHESSYGAMNRLQDDSLAKGQINQFDGRNENDARGGGWHQNASRSMLTQLERDTIAKANAGGIGGHGYPDSGYGSAQSNLELYEANLLRNQLGNGPNMGYNTMGHTSSQPMGYDAGMYYNDPNNQHNYIDGRYDNRAQQIHPHREYDESAAALASMRELELQVLARSGYPQSAPDPRGAGYQLNSVPQINHGHIDTPEEYVESAYSSAPDATVAASVAYAAEPEAPIYPAIGDSTDIAGAETGGIEAFVAENVVDATGVAVIMSDEEEAVLEKKRIRRLFCIGTLCVVIILVAIIAHLMTRNSPAPPVSKAPTLSPTQAPTLSPTVQLIPEAFEVLSSYSDPLALQSRESPQFRAMDWLVNDDQYTRNLGLSYSDPKWIQRYFMGLFYFQFNGDKWDSCNRNDNDCKNQENVTSWLSNADECTWILLGCDSNGLLTKINFLQGKTDYFRTTDTPLTGQMPLEIQYLTGLQQFVFPELSITGDVLSLLSGMPDLITLSLNNNNVTGTIASTFASEHPNLVTLDVGGNALSGPIPSSLALIVSLETLNLGDNTLDGNIPSDLGTMSSLRTLNLEKNLLVGEIPVSIYNNRIVSLSMGSNGIQGSIPGVISNMTSLVSLYFSKTKMSGFIPDSLFTLTQLTSLDLSDCDFTGPISADLGKLSLLKVLNLDENNFTGTLPSSIANLTVLEKMHLYDNPNLGGTIPESMCARRGYLVGQIAELESSCKMECTCCDNRC